MQEYLSNFLIASCKEFKIITELCRETGPHGYGRRFIIWRSWVRIPAPWILDGHFSHWFVVKIVSLFVEKTKINKKRGRRWSIIFLKNTLGSKYLFYFLAFLVPRSPQFLFFLRSDYWRLSDRRSRRHLPPSNFFDFERCVAVASTPPATPKRVKIPPGNSPLRWPLRTAASRHFFVVVWRSLPIWNLVRRCKDNNKPLGSGCGSVGRAVASDNRGLRFKSSHWQIFIQNISLLSTVL